MEEDIIILEKFIKSDPKAKELKRALAIKFVKLGSTYSQIKNLLNVSKGFITKWRHIYEEKGIEALKVAYKGSQGYLSKEEKQEVINWLKGGEYWTLAQLQTYVKETYGVTYQSKSSYYELFKLARISWKKSQKRNPKKDLARVAEKQAEIKKD